MTNITYREYRDEISDIAEDLYKEAMEEHPEDEDDRNEYILERVNEIVDGHQWIIYCTYNLSVYEHSPNPGAYQDIYGNDDLGSIVADRGLLSLHTIIAYCAMQADIEQAVWQLDQGAEPSEPAPSVYVPEKFETVELTGAERDAYITKRFPKQGV